MMNPSLALDFPNNASSRCPRGLRTSTDRMPAAGTEAHLVTSFVLQGVGHRASTGITAALGFLLTRERHPRQRYANRLWVPDSLFTVSAPSIGASQTA